MGLVIVVIIIAGAAFYGGTVYAKRSTGRAQFANGQFPTGGAGGFAARGGARSAGTGGGFTAGEIVSATGGSISIKMQNGSSTELVLIGSSTQILKSAAGTASDLSVGANVTVTGTSNSDGSLSASSIQIRPAAVSPAQRAGS